ncbi:nuclear transport factor 2 family protein [Olivibacter sp. CPCC 100613]|uniref:nuclear transport factor 2 family protein n=1 Tax=Olivibacter sp. CPCC 100613 TaxID=3079931 RepID=UPI002FFA6896
MKSLKHQIFLILTLTCFVFSFQQAFAQAQTKEIEALVHQQDSLFWEGYNRCDIELQGQLISDDVEFYHDKGGITRGKAALLASIKNNLCSSNFRLRREPIKETIKIHLLRSGESVYGALITGEHLFYVKEENKNERLDGHALFANLWLLKDGKWLMSRVLSYDHGPASYSNTRKEMVLNKQILQSYTGTYKGPQSGDMLVTVKDTHLLLTIGTKDFEIYPESEQVFFMKERDLTFSFVQTEKSGRKLVVREFGDIVEEATQTSH